ncbi:zinc finger protein, putative, partial [Ixodes scapularis]
MKNEDDKFHSGSDRSDRSRSSSHSKKFRMNEGDWLCADSQVDLELWVVAGAEKAELLSKRKLGHEIGKAAAEKSRGLFSADDWQCGRCGNVNWARRQSCNMCNAPKFGEVEERTGLGGGYNEREDVEYVEREESDGEYDDFGRRRKKARREVAPQSAAKPSSQPPAKRRGTPRAPPEAAPRPAPPPGAPHAPRPTTGLPPAPGEPSSPCLPRGPVGRRGTRKIP